MIRNLTFAILIPLLFGTSVGAQQAGAQQGAGQMGVNDGLFVQAAGVGGLAEVTLSQLGLKKATHADLKQFSQRMIDEHSRVNTELKTIAAGKRLQVPQAVDARAAFCAASLAGLSGEEFDRCFAKAQLIAHMDALAAFEAEAERGQDPEIRAFAAKVAPHIKEHLETIRPIAMKLAKDSDERKK